MRLYTLKQTQLATPDWLADEKPHILKRFDGQDILLLFADDLPHAAELEALRPRMLRDDESIKTQLEDIGLERVNRLFNILTRTPGFAENAERVARRFAHKGAAVALSGMLFSNEIAAHSQGKGHNAEIELFRMETLPSRSVLILSPRHWTYAHACSDLLGLALCELTEAPLDGYLQSQLWHELGHLETRLKGVGLTLTSWQDELISDLTIGETYIPRGQPEIAQQAKDFRLLSNFIAPFDRKSASYWNVLTQKRNGDADTGDYQREIEAHLELKIAAARAVEYGTLRQIDLPQNCQIGHVLGTRMQRYASVREAFAFCSDRNPHIKLDLLATLPALAKYDGFSRPETAELASATHTAAIKLMPKLMHKMAAA
jgi:hypothetical protein